jgi:3-oxoacyl-[acyl-carrier protein] reductase
MSALDHARLIMGRLESKKAVVTGASSGIGRAIALAFAREGADVIISFRTARARAETVAAEIRALGRDAHVLQADFSEAGAAERLVTAARTQFPSIDIWVNNAGADILTGAGAALDDGGKLERLLAVDLEGTIRCCWGVVPVMRARGRGAIINVSWDLAVHGFPGRNPQMFAAVKAGVLGFSKALARDSAPEVRVNVLAPGWIRTAFADGAMDPAYLDARVSEIPLRRMGEPADVAPAAVFLASDEAAYITGQVLNVNGGLI